MSEIFLPIVNMSISASWIVLAVLLLRLLIKKAPKWITVLLWGVVALRLICPFAFESVLSLIPSAQTISPEIMMDKTPEINTGIQILNNTLNPIIGESFTPAPGDSANPLQILIPVLAAIWIFGMALLLSYTVISYSLLKRRVATAVLLRDNIYQSENVTSPFVLGVIKPRIYLPFNMKEQDALHVVAHEQAHIRRKDHLWKLLGFLILTLHWFNPLMWIGYMLLCRDIELACDEKVVRGLDSQQIADYSHALLSCSANRRMIAACPLAFGDVGVKDRVRAVLNYKRPAFWIIAAAIAACAVLAVCFLTNPKAADDDIALTPVYNSHGEYIGFNDIPSQYSAEDAIADGCLVIDINGGITNAKGYEHFLTFVETSGQGENAFLRVANYADGLDYYQDLYYCDGKYIIFSFYGSGVFKECYSYLRCLNSDPYDFYVLTDSMELTYSDVLSVVLSSDSSRWKELPPYTWLSFTIYFE